MSKSKCLSSDQNVQAVYIASPVVFHKEQAMMAVECGKHVLLEKPIELTAKDGSQVVAACEAKRIKAAAGFVMRFHSLHQTMQQMIHTGQMEQIVSCRARLTCWYPDMPGAWRQKKSLAGGGATLDLAVHCIDLIRYVTGQQVSKIAGLVGTKTFHYEVDDSGTLLFETDQGVYCTVEVNFSIPDEAFRNRFEIYGTRGCLIAERTISQVEGSKLEVTRVPDNHGYHAQQERVSGESYEVAVSPGNLYTREIGPFNRSIIEETPVEVHLVDALEAQMVVEAARLSSNEKTVVMMHSGLHHNLPDPGTHKLLAA